MIDRALYRSRQFFTSLRPRVDASLRGEAYALLPEPQRRLFESMTPRDQQHCLDVYRRLRDEHDDRDLLIAALLHDAGKGRIALWHRVAYVALDATSPALLRRVATPGSGLHRCLHHAELGAALAREAGASERTAALIAEDAASAPEPALRALRAADDAA